VTTIYLSDNKIGDEGAAALADALKVNTFVTTIYLSRNEIGIEGAAALADALKVNMSVTTGNLDGNVIGAEGAAALADALEVNTSVTYIALMRNQIGNEGAAALANGLHVNTALTTTALGSNAIDESNSAKVDALIARNTRFRSLFLFDARRMLLSLMCADECGVVWPYLLGNVSTEGVVAPDDVKTIRAEFLSDVVAERRRRLQGVPEAKRRRRK
jgi:Ran GTPase-activating protein (RanGAP) involved in mRNA processing and transport